MHEVFTLASLIVNGELRIRISLGHRGVIPVALPSLVCVVHVRHSSIHVLFSNDLCKLLVLFLEFLELSDDAPPILLMRLHLMGHHAIRDVILVNGMSLMP